ncbi:hypothetical protein D3C87_1725790 [compost metagenome]
MRTGEELERALAAWAIGGIALAIIGTAISLLVMYFIIRWAVRDGMRDAQQGLRAERTPARQRPTSTAHLPEMRAD